MEHILDLAAFGELNSEELEDDILFEILQPRARSEMRSTRFGRINLNSISDKESEHFFRFRIQDLHHLAVALGLPETISYESRLRTSGVEGLAVLLRRLAYPNRLADLEPLFGLSAPYLSVICSGVMKFILQKHGNLLQNLNAIPYLNEDKLEEYSQVVHRKGAPMTNCWGFIDGTARAICRPTVGQAEYYSGHKRQHCLKYLGILCPDGIVTSLHGPYPGRRHDSGVLRESDLYNSVRNFATFPTKKYCIYGDSGFPLKELLLTPFGGSSLNSHQQEFNTTMSSMRQPVEWGFGKTICEFAFLDFKKNQKILLQEVANMYHCATILTNCHSCLYGNQTATYFQLQPPTLNEYLNYGN